MYAITETGYRAVSEEMAIAPGETRVDELPATLLARIRADQIKTERGQRLRSTDWTQLPDSPLAEKERQEWTVYRQALRDLPELPGFPDCGWPPSPAEG